MAMISWIAGGLLLAGVAFFAIGPAQIWAMIAGDADLGALALADVKRTGKPNDALLGPAEKLSTPPDGPTPTFAVPPEELFAQLLAQIDPDSTVTWAQRDPDTLYARAITRSPFMKFPDTNHIWVLPHGEGGSTLALYAAAQLGHSDLGKNRQRLNAWLALIEDLPSAQRQTL